MSDTRHLFITAAAKAFAEKGFYGASIASIAAESPFTKQALLHHFGNKEKLYAEVLKGISDRLMASLQDIQRDYPDTRQRLEQTFLSFYRQAVGNRDEMALLMRELLDNKRRAESAQAWYLKPFLDELTQMVMTVLPAYSRPRAFTLAYQMLGAIHYFAVSEPTLVQIFGREEYEEVLRGYEDELRDLIRARLGD